MINISEYLDLNIKGDNISFASVLEGNVSIKSESIMICYKQDQKPYVENLIAETKKLIILSIYRKIYGDLESKISELEKLLGFVIYSEFGVNDKLNEIKLMLAKSKE